MECKNCKQLQNELKRALAALSAVQANTETLQKGLNKLK